MSKLRKVLKPLHYPPEVMLVCARRYADYPLGFGKTPSPRHLEEMVQERGVFVGHSTVHRWALKIHPVLTLIFRRREHPVWTSWRMDEPYIKVAGEWKYLYRAVDKAGDTVDFLLAAERDKAAARRYLERGHRAVKRVTDPMLGFKSFWSAQKLIADIETMHMVEKGQLRCSGGQPVLAADQFYSLAS